MIGQRAVAIVERLNAEIARALQNALVRKDLEAYQRLLKAAGMYKNQ